MYSTMESVDWNQIKPLESIYFEGSVVADSRKIKNGDIFIAYCGEYVDGRKFIPQAVARGAVAVIYQATSDFIAIDYGVPMYAVENLPRLAGIITSHLLHNISSNIKVLGVTGTNGKTSITQWLAQALDKLGEKSAVIGTNGNGFWHTLEKSTHTTPDAVSVQNLIKSYVQQKANYLSIEVSSHGIDQARVNGIEFDTVVFTNLTRDHLDYHHSFTNYFEVKKRLFYWNKLRHAVINIDDSYGQKLVAELKQNNPGLMISSYGFSDEATIYIEKANYSLEGMILTLSSPWGRVIINNSLLGAFNAQNLAATFGILCGLGYMPDKVAGVLNQIKPAKGRMQSIRYPDRPVVIVDYAHTPDALQNVLQSLAVFRNKRSKSGKIWCVFGCGGDRDSGKRPLMGHIAQEYADYCVVTSDNPRNEHPEKIIQDILPVKNSVLIEVDREKAIAYAIQNAKSEDIVLIAGKGHENYQEISGIRHYFDDLEIAQKYLEVEKK
ncbi:MAG: UDP-N-acetylmuramoyl-L-alanyl-D-glutamate--2,6-diaminopimelate ligase [Neisseriaceae bacterium]|nr:MAG: UDP-N-acetylmuramoyl-L-alanyl-D-glutamate--2,6-diaminopimelate ligase [Neisseriaceae bacterium]